MTSRATATRAADGRVTLTVHDAGEIVAVPLELRAALLLGVDLINLAAEGEVSLAQAGLPLWGDTRREK
jgi:hypothetical protein